VAGLTVGALRALDYLAISLMVGGLAFLGLVWEPGLAVLGGREPSRAAVALAFRRRLAALLALAVGLGLAVGLLGIALRDEWPPPSRPGAVWALDILDWAALGALLLATRRATRPRRALSGLILAGCGFLVISPALGPGEARGAALALSFAHVLAASAWVGGVACLLIALPAATRPLSGAARSQLMATMLARFSPIALGAVIAIVISGVLHAALELSGPAALLGSAFGVLVIAKGAMLIPLAGLGALNRQRVIPALKRRAADGAAPGRASAVALRNLGVELALMLAVLIATAALVAHAPATAATAGGARSGHPAQARVG
jgi:copper transport protein